MSKILLHSGKMLDLSNPAYEDVDIDDIAHGLSNICRFNGSCPRFYSVAEHSILVSMMVPKPMAAVALLHDAHEAYIGDIVTPVKEIIGSDRLSALKARLDDAIWSKLLKPGAAPFHDMEIDIADRRMLQVEQSKFFPHYDQSLAKMESPLDCWTVALWADRIQFMTPDAAFHQFMRRAKEVL